MREALFHCRTVASHVLAAQLWLRAVVEGKSRDSKRRTGQVCIREGMKERASEEVKGRK
jgi:hypothetical protein